MKIQDILLEYASTKPIIAYHTTIRPHLKSILKQGLIPNKSDGGYASDAESSAGYSLSALPGIYFFKEYTQAKHLANDLNSKNEQDSLIIICQVQPKTASLDEDNLVSSVLRENYLARNFRKLLSSGILDDTAVNNAAKDILNSLSKQLDSRLINNITPHVHSYVQSLAEFVRNKSTSTEQNLKSNQEILTNKLRQLLLNNNSKNEHDSFKINDNIGFSGANRIVGFYLPQQRVGWGNLGDFERDAYHKYDSPMQLVKKD